MGAYDAAKDFAKAAITAGLSVEIIQLLEKKRDLLLEEVGDLQKTNSNLEAENKTLKKQVSDLQKEVADVSPEEKNLPDPCKRFLGLLFDSNELLTTYQLTCTMGIPAGMVHHHADTLQGLDMVKIVGAWPDGGHTYELTPKGRAYVAQNR